MANLQGYTSGAVGNMLNHYTRHDGDPEQDRYRYGNQQIDTSRTHLNYALFEREDPRAFIEGKIAAVRTKPTKTTNVISDWIVTLPDNGKLAGREREFFEQSFEFVAAKVGRENVVGAWVHMDETSPHIHICFVPFCEQQQMTNDKSQPLRWTARDEKLNPDHKEGEVKRDKKGTIRYKRVPALDDDGNPMIKRTISQSAVFDRQSMKTFHPELTEHMRKHFGFDVGVELEDEGDKQLSRLNHTEYKAAKMTLEKTRREVAVSNAEVKRLNDKREEIRRQVAEEAHRLERLRSAREEAAERVDGLEALVAECRTADAATIGRKSEIFRRISSFCARYMEKLGVKGKAAVATVKTALTIGVRRTSVDAGIARVNAVNSKRSQAFLCVQGSRDQRQKQLQPTM